MATPAYGTSPSDKFPSGTKLKSKKTPKGAKASVAAPIGKRKVVVLPQHVTVPVNDRQLSTFCQQYHIPFVVTNDQWLVNCHRLSAALRSAAMFKCAVVASNFINRKPDLRIDPGIINMFPRANEVDLYRKMMKIQPYNMAGKKIPLQDLTVNGFRDSLRGTDFVRQREIFDTSLFDSDLFLMFDAHYYIPPENLVNMFALHPNITEGIHIIIGGRRFARDGLNVILERFKRAKMKEKEGVVPQWTTVREPVLNARGEPVMRINEDGEEEPKTREVSKIAKVEITFPAVEAVDCIEGVGSTLNGIVHFRASTNGDSSYSHPAGDWLFTHSVRHVFIEEDVYRLSFHHEGTVGHYEIVSVALQLLDNDPNTDDVPIVQHHSIGGGQRPPGHFVYKGLIPDIYSVLYSKCIGIDYNSANSIDQLRQTGVRLMVTGLGDHYENLSDFHLLFTKAAHETVQYALTASRPEMPLILPAAMDSRQAVFNRRVTLVRGEGIPTPMAEAIALVEEKQSIINLAVRFVGWAGKWISHVWDKIVAWWRGGGNESPLNMFGHVSSLLNYIPGYAKWAKQTRKTLANLAWFRSAMVRLNDFFGHHPKIAVVVDKLIMLILLLPNSIGEEAMKRVGPVWVGSIFGAIEYLLLDLTRYGLPQWSNSWRHLGVFVFRVAVHTLLRWMPFWPAVLVHTLYNLYATRTDSVTALLRLYVETELMYRDVEDLTSVPMSAPRDMSEESQFYVKELGQKVPVKDVLRFLSDPGVLKSQKLVAIESDVSDQLVRPGSGIRNAMVMDCLRLSAEMPADCVAKPGAWSHATAVLLGLILLPSVEEYGCKPWNLDETLAYIAGCSRTTAWKEECSDLVRRSFGGEDLSNELSMFVKSDETVVASVAAEDPLTEARAVKARPVIPRTKGDVPLFALMGPLKKFFSRTFILAWCAHRSAFVPVDRNHLGPLLTFTYISAPRADRIGEWLVSWIDTPGIHVLAHGDDQWALWIPEYIDPKASAYDLAKCDKSCGTEAQNSFYHIFMALLCAEGVDVERVVTFLNQSRANLHGEFKLRDRLLDLVYFYIKHLEEESTNTGEILTSLKAFLAQFVAFIYFFTFFTRGELDAEKYAKHFERVVRTELGLVPEFERSVAGAVWQPITVPTFLGGNFYKQGDYYQWLPNNYLKTYFMHPDKLAGIYKARPVGTYSAIEVAAVCHMNVLLTDPHAEASPLHRALSAWHRRCIERFVGKIGSSRSRRAVELLKNSAKHWIDWRTQFDSYKFGLETEDSSAFVVPPVSYINFFDGWRSQLESRGCEELAQDFPNIILEIEGGHHFDGRDFFPKLQASAVSLFYTRFSVGGFVRPVNDRPIQLSLLKHLFFLATKNFSDFSESVSDFLFPIITISSSNMSKKERHLATRLVKLEVALKKQSANPQALERQRFAQEKSEFVRRTQVAPYQGYMASKNGNARMKTAKTRAKKVGGARMKQPGAKHHVHLSAWAEQQAFPMRRSDVPPPFTDNPSPSVQTTSARTVCLRDITVKAGTCVQISLPPSGVINAGYSQSVTYNGSFSADSAPGDQVAAHAKPLGFNDTAGAFAACAVAPISTTVQTNVAGTVGTWQLLPSAGIISAQTTAGLGALTTSNAITYTGVATLSGIRWEPLTPTTGLPYAGTLQGHARYILTGQVLRVLNTTAQGSRAGDIVTVRPPSSFEAVTVVNQNAFSKFRTYRVHNVDSPHDFIVPLRVQDYLYQHAQLNPYALGVSGAANVPAWLAGTACTSVSNAAMHCWLNNPSANDQSYTIEVVCNWSIAGDLVAGLTAGAAQSPEAKPVIQGASVKMSNKAVTDSKGVWGTFTESAKDLAAKGINLAIKSGTSMLSEGAKAQL